jgi:hypothetical protein
MRAVKPPELATPAAPSTREARGAMEESWVSRPSGPAAAVVLAAGVACFTLGLLSVLTAASGVVSDALTLSDGVGDVSGVSTATALVFFASWGALTFVWRRANPSLALVAAVSAALVAAGLLGTFPPVFNAFG